MEVSYARLPNPFLYNSCIMYFYSAVWRRCPLAHKWAVAAPHSVLPVRREGERGREGESEPRRKVAINKVRMAEGAEIHAVAIGSGDRQRSVHSQQETRVNGLVRPPHAAQARRKDPMEHC